MGPCSSTCHDVLEGGFYYLFFCSSLWRRGITMSLKKRRPDPASCYSAHVAISAAGVRVVKGCLAIMVHCRRARGVGGGWRGKRETERVLQSQLQLLLAKWCVDLSAFISIAWICSLHPSRNLHASRFSESRLSSLSSKCDTEGLAGPWIRQFITSFECSKSLPGCSLIIGLRWQV